MANEKNFYSDYLQSTDHLFTILSRLPGFKEQMAAQGFDDERVSEGDKKRNEAEDVHLELLKKLNERDAQREIVKRTYKEAHFPYSGFVKRLRPELYDDPEFYARLGLIGKRQTTISGFNEESTLFYDVSITNETVAAKLLTLKITKEMLQAGLDKLAEYKKARSKYEEIKGELQSLGVERRKAFRKLKFWVAAFKEAALVAYADNSQELEKINIFVRNSPIRKKKAAIDSTETTEPPALPEPTGTTQPTEPTEPVTITQVIDTTEPPALAETAE